MGEHVANWDLILPTAEFTYNSSVNRSIWLSPFEALTGYQPRKPIDLVPLPIGPKVSASAKDYAQHIHDLHTEIRRRLTISNDNYKSAADNHRKLQEFSVGDKVLVRVRPKRFPHGTVKKLHARRTDPYRVLRRVGPNAYELNIPRDHGINPVFNVEDLTLYHESMMHPFPSVDDPAPSTFAPGIPIPPSPPLPPWRQSSDMPQIEYVIVDELVSTTDGGYQRFLVR